VILVSHSDHTIEMAAQLKAKAARYRGLAESIFDPVLVAEVQDFARELELEAVSLEHWRERRAA
jgi:hypothetical protein